MWRISRRSMYAHSLSLSPSLSPSLSLACSRALSCAPSRALSCCLSLLVSLSLARSLFFNCQVRGQTSATVSARGSQTVVLTAGLRVASMSEAVTFDHFTVFSKSFISIKLCNTLQHTALQRTATREIHLTIFSTSPISIKRALWQKSPALGQNAGLFCHGAQELSLIW